MQGPRQQPADRKRAPELGRRDAGDGDAAHDEAAHDEAAHDEAAPDEAAPDDAGHDDAGHDGARRSREGGNAATGETVQEKAAGPERSWPARQSGDDVLAGSGPTSASSPGRRSEALVGQIGRAHV